MEWQRLILFVLPLTLIIVKYAPSLATEGKTVHIIVGFAAGGGFDTYSRVIARHMGKHIPGNPAFVVKNMPGRGSLEAANYMYSEAKPDGLTIGSWMGLLVMQQVLERGEGEITFDASKFEWVGVPVRESPVCALTKASGITSIEKWIASKTPIRLGGTAPGDTTDDVPKILKAALGLPIQVVSGYKGTADIRLASENGEVAGGCWAWESIKLTWGTALAAGNVNIVLQVTPRPLPDFLNVPSAINLATTDDARRLIQVIHDLSAIIRPYVAPPGTPKEWVKTLRKAFMDTMRDPEFLAEVRRFRLDIDPLPGEEVEKIIAGLYRLDPALLNRLKDTLK